MNASSGRDVTSGTVNSEREECIGIRAPSENESANNNVLHISKTIDEIRNNNPDQVSDLSVPETRFDRKSHTFHSTDPSNSFSLFVK